MKKKLTIDPLIYIKIYALTSVSLITKLIKIVAPTYMTYLKVTSSVSDHLNILKNRFL